MVKVGDSATLTYALIMSLKLYTAVAVMAPTIADRSAAVVGRTDLMGPRRKVVVREEGGRLFCLHGANRQFKQNSHLCPNLGGGEITFEIVEAG